jgi:ATP-dependent DNA ligase
MLRYRARRARLERALTDVAPESAVQLIPMTTDRAAALTWFDPAFAGRGIEGLVAKPLIAPYRGRRGPWVKIRRTLVVQATVMGITGTPHHPDALVLALPADTTDTGPPRAIGLSTTLPAQVRAALAGRLRPMGEPQQLAGVVGGLPGHPATHYVPVAAGITVEIEADACIEFGRFRHRPRSCVFGTYSLRCNIDAWTVPR